MRVLEETFGGCLDRSGLDFILVAVIIGLINLIFQFGLVALSGAAPLFGGYISPDSIQLWLLAFEAFRSFFNAVLHFAQVHATEFCDTLVQSFDRDQFFPVNDPLLI